MIGRLIDGRYQVRSRIARGGMATVYLATDLRLERRVAIKIMHGHLADDSQFKERFIQEARSAARLAHPNVVNVFDQGQDSDMAYLVMEYLPGITLRDLLTEHKTLTTEQTLDILEAVLSGLAAAHKAGIVHRDLKPENVLLADDGRIKIGDFGLARAASANTATGAALLGTIAYLSPELVTRGVADARSDIYAVGIMMYEMLAGEQPFKGEQPMQIAYQHANSSVPTPSTKNSRVPAELDELVLWATAREPDQRPRDARAMLDQLLETQQQLQTALPTAATQVQRTTVMPTTLLAPGSDAETQVIRPRQPAHRTGPLATEATSALAESAGKRKARGWWIFAIVLLLAAVAGGAGWYFGVGPGASISIPSNIVGMEPDAATAAIEELGLVVADETTSAYSSDVPEGSVTGSSPEPGAAVQNGSTVTLELSDGPQPVDVPEIVGVDEETATARITEAGFVLDNDSRVAQFNSRVGKGDVISLFGKKDGKSDGSGIELENGDSYFDQAPVSIVVSLGKLPSVKGMTLENAIKTLDKVGVIGVEGKSTYSDDIDEGRVIKGENAVSDEPVREGSTIRLTLSRGPELFEVPGVNGLLMKDAKKLLEEAGFVVSFDGDDDVFANLVLNTVNATGTDPGVGQQLRKGAAVELLYEL